MDAADVAGLAGVLLTDRAVGDACAAERTGAGRSVRNIGSVHAVVAPHRTRRTGIAGLAVGLSVPAGIADI